MKNYFFILSQKKVKALHFRCVFEHGWVAFYFSKVIRVLTENISQSLLVKHFYFSIFCNIFFYTQLGFIFCLLGDLLYGSQPYCSFLFLYPSERSQYLLQAFFEVFLCFLIIFSWLIFRHFYIWKKNYIKNDKKWFKALYCIITINFLMNHLIIAWKPIMMF